ncbi:MAG: PAS domain S-box protein, partial [Bacillota bacterium]
ISDGKILQVNRSAEEIYGYSSKEMIGRTSIELGLFADQKDREKAIGILKENGFLRDFSIYIVRKTGERRYVSLAVEMVDLSGEQCMLTSVRDITERKKAEESLTFQAMLLSSVNDAIIAADENFKITFWNKSAEELLGYRADEAIGQRANKLLHTKLDEMTLEEAAEILLKEGRYKGEVYYLRKDGTYVLTEVNSKELYGPDGSIKGIISILRDITERKRIEEALRQSEERFLKAFISSPYAMTITKLPEGIWTDINESFLRLTGYSREELLGHTSVELNMVIEKDPQERARIIKSITETGSVTDAEVNIRTKAGAFRQVILSAVITKLNNEDFVITQHVDITERKKAEEALKIREAQLDAFFANSPAILNLVDENFCYINTDKLTPTYYGLNRETIKGKCVQDLSKDFIEQTGKVMQRIIETGEPVLNEQYQAPVPGRGGEMAYWSTSMFRVPLGRDKWGVGVISLEITDIKRAEWKLRKSEERLLDAQKLAHVGSFSYDLLTGKVEWSEEMFNIYEIDPSKAAPPIELVQAYFHPGDREWMNKAIKTGTENNEIINFEARLLLPGDKLKYINYIGRPLHDDSGRPIGRTGAISDITSIKLQQIELENTLEDLKRSNKDLERFAFAASHDLQEPIRMMGSYAHLLLKRYKGNLGPQADRYLKFMFEGALRLQVLIRDLLNYDRLRTGKTALSKIDLNSVLTDALYELRKPVAETNADITFRSLPEILADRNQIKQLFTHLLSNAIKFRKQDTVPKINISAEDRGKEWLFQVEDNGIGIEAEFSKLIFDVFQRLNDREEYPGVGIGLAICRRIVDRHGGNIWVESEVGKGSRFYFIIPKKESKVL